MLKSKFEFGATENFSILCLYKIFFSLLDVSPLESLVLEEPLVDRFEYVLQSLLTIR